jgi:hypothetical protein
LLARSIGVLTRIKIVFLVPALWLFPLLASAQLAVTVSPVKTTGQKAVVPLAMNNNFAEKIESARAACFLCSRNSFRK